jgi:hypothetical protein
MEKIVLFYILSFLFLFVIISPANELQVYPPYDFIHDEGTSFYVFIYCLPTAPIKAYEFKISFNQSCLRASSVETGHFFGEYPTFFCSGIINNTAGTIINIYELIIGPGNVTTSGITVIIGFTTLTSDGVSQITIYDAGVTNETQYLIRTVKGGGRRIYGVYYPWDINQDFRCNVLDLSAVVSHYAITCNPPGSKRWDSIPDGKCNYLEMSMMVAHLGT